MKIRLAILMSDEAYLTRFANAVTLQYADRIDLWVFTKAENAMESIIRYRADILLVGEEFTEALKDVPAGTEVICFTGKKDVSMINDYRAICKYQKVTAIYREIAELYAEKTSSEAILLKAGDSNKKILTFLPGGGGAGASTLAAACAVYLARRNEKVLYLNLEQTGKADFFFSGEGSDDFGRVIYALEMGRGTAPIRIENAIRRDVSGVLFFAGCASALDMLSLDTVRAEQLFEALSVINLYDWIVVDMDGTLGESLYRQIERSYATVLVSDGSESVNAKLERKLAAFDILAEQRKAFPLNRIFLMYNQFSSRTGKKAANEAYKEIGGINCIANATTKELLQLIADNPAFGELLELPE